MSKKARNIALTIIILAGIAGLVYVWSNYGFNPNAQEAPTLSKKTTGYIQLDGAVVPDKIADLGFVSSASITSILKKVGDTVKKGDVLATQDTSDVRAQVAAAQANVVGARAELDKLKHDLKKEKLALHGLDGNAYKQQKAQISSNEDSVEVQKSAIEVAQDGVANAQAQLAKTILKSPFDGIITRQDGEAGEVGGSMISPFMTIVTGGPFKKIEAQASDLDVADIHVDDSAKATFYTPDAQKTISAKVISIDPATNAIQGKTTYKVTLMLDQEDAAIRLGMHASITF
jgi:RND family efflux transporter MFP subunit